jgi:hypothetical protein
MPRNDLFYGFRHAGTSGVPDLYQRDLLNQHRGERVPKLHSRFLVRVRRAKHVPAQLGVGDRRVHTKPMLMRGGILRQWRAERDVSLCPMLQRVFLRGG